ncbi:MAG TPA: TlpA disulfide reductase family protein [Ginsengibacter sp.]
MNLLVAALLIISLNSFSQQKSLQIGDQCPDILIKHMINYKTNEVSISSFKGKLLILDFWATWCAPCVSMIPHSDSLQKKFENNIQILPVTDQDSQTVRQFLENFNQFSHINMPSATGDRILQSLFPHSVIPHYVWIDQNGKVIAITGAEQLTESNIKSLLNGNHPELPVKQDMDKVIDESKPMFTVGNELIQGNETKFEKIEDSSLLFHSVITRHIDGFGCESGVTAGKIEVKNDGIGGLYRVAVGHYQLSKLNMNSTIWEVTNPSVQYYTDSASLKTPNGTAMDLWMKNYTFCYELKFPSSLNNKKFDIMLSDLNNYFGAVFNIEGGLEHRKAKCLALIQTGKVSNFVSKGIGQKSTFDQYHLKITNMPMKGLVNYLGINLDLMPPLVDETNYNGKIDVDLNCNLSDLASVNEALAKYGLHLQEEEREMDMIVIKDKPKSK